MSEMSVSRMYEESFSICHADMAALLCNTTVLHSLTTLSMFELQENCVCYEDRL
jgi:hypothetical protein